MPQFFYRAKSLKGQEMSGQMVANDIEELRKALKSKGYFLISAETESTVSPKKTPKKLSQLSDLFGIPLSEKIFFTRNLQVMISSGVPLPRAFSLLSHQTKSGKFKKILQEIAERVIKGESLSRAFSNYPDVFPRIYQETLKVGEETGKLDESLDILAHQMEREHAIKSQVKTAMIYPVVVLCIAFLIGIVMFVVVVPKLKEAFSEIGAQLPLTTRMILAFSDFISTHLIVIPVLVTLLLGGAIFLMKKLKGSKLISAVALKIPLLSKIVRNINSALTLRTLSSLMASGVPIVHSLDIASGALGNFYFREALKRAAQFVEKGRRLSEALEGYSDLYSPMVVEMLKVGEETGETPRMLSTLADFYEKEISADLKRLTSVIEPFLILVVGGMVGFFAISMMQPMFSIMQHIG